MRILGYLLSAVVLDGSRAGRPPVREPAGGLPPIATTEATAAAWRRWALSGIDEADPREPDRAPARRALPSPGTTA